MKSRATCLLTHGDGNIRVAADGVTHGKINASLNPNSKKTHCSGHRKLPETQGNSRRLFLELILTPVPPNPTPRKYI